LYNRLGHAYYESGNFDLAIEDFDQAQHLDASDADSRYTLGLLLATRSPELALSLLLRAAQLDPKLAPVVQNLRQGLSAALLSANLDDQLVGSGRTLAGAGDWKLGYEAFSNAVKENPSNALAWAWLGLARQILGVDGLTELDRAVNLDPTSAEIHGLRGLFFLRGNQYEKARDEFQAAADLEPSNPGWQVSLGDTLARTGNVPQGLEHYQKAVDLSPRSDEYWRMLANFTVDYNFDIQVIGFPAALQARALAPDDPQNSVTLGRLYFSSGDMESAEKIWLEALKVHPELADAHLYLGILYLQQGKNNSAQSHLTSAEELDPSGAYGVQAGHLLKQYFP
jgi:tetratricopeptide (TPR) repeat protein